MNVSSIDLKDLLRALLAKGEPLTARQLKTATEKSQPSISLALAKLEAQVHRLGAARSTRYALTQPILGLDAHQPVHLAGPHNDDGLFGQLTFLQGDWLHVRGPRKTEWLTQRSLPWWLSTLRPQGFLGRQYARLRPDFAADPDQWTLAQVLYMAANHIADPPGAFAIGALTNAGMHSPAQAARPDSAITTGNAGIAFDALADALTSTLPAGSSAGGEQPKFTTRVGDAHVIVKYSPPRGTPFGERWHDLLHLEHLALSVLAKNGIPTASTRIVESQARTYLESTRFDRIGLQGKRHVVPASALHEEFVKSPRRHWVATCEALVQQKMLALEDVKTVASAYLFGQYIGNTDMHFGNLSFFVDDVTKPALLPTPVYDMLPMMWRPGIHDGALDATPVQPQIQPAGYAAQAVLAHSWAIDYWERAAQLPTLSDALRDASAACATRLKTNFAG